MLRYRGSRAVISVPADTELAAMFVPSWARAKAAAMKKTPVRFPEVPSSRKDWRSWRGFQIGSPLKMMVEEDETMMPINEVIPKPTGMVMSCDHKASVGVRANRAKSGSFWRVVSTKLYFKS